ncbi:hypothetical protein G6L37_34820 [Agrobacterium rubi]|nr:hypothetical protein [Agrobacterium rubi]NTF23742.1 hypothetical protein [Agrobacterium rubi]
MNNDTMTTKRLGYLRLARPSTSEPSKSPSAPITAMWRKLSKMGLIEDSRDGAFRRTSAGDKTLRDFDGDLPDAIRRVLNAVKAGASGAAAMKGLHAAINAGLVIHVDANPRYVLTDDGKALADPIGEDGYFRKSGNLVRVLSVCWENGYEGLLEVERLEGESSGKRILIHRETFVSKSEWEAMQG